MEGLIDLDYGTWQMRTHDEIRVTDPDAFKLWHSAPHHRLTLRRRTTCGFSR
jgi:broad specificity phosphatase PhoE